MIKFNFNVRVPQIDQRRFIGALEQVIEEAMIKAIRAFLVAAVPRVPIYTGFARGTFRNLEDIAGRVERAQGGFRIRGNRRGSSIKSVAARGRDRPRYYKGVLKTQDSGRQFATPPSGVLTKIKGKTSVSFKFSVNIDYFDKLDREKWKSFDAGMKAFNATLTQALKNLTARNPILGKTFDIKQYITRKQFT
jgi:hypothetical protein